jgi:uncharacterized RDD family membrane protein YckC
MSTADDYIKSVLEYLPANTPLRSQIAMELRAHFAERVEHGRSEADVLQLLGDPRALAESYLAAVPLIAPGFMTRVGAKLADIFAVGVCAGLAALALIAAFDAQRDLGFAMSIGAMVMFLGGSVLFAVYTVVAEAAYGRTLGKALFGLRVVTESGTRISAGQALVRQLPMFLQIYMIDVLFALFTKRSQRAFEVLSKTRVVTDVQDAPTVLPVPAR